MKLRARELFEKDLLSGEVTARLAGGVLTVARFPPKGLLAIGWKILFALWLMGWAVGEFQMVRVFVFNLPYKGVAHARSDMSGLWFSFLIWSLIGIAAIVFFLRLLLSGPETLTLDTDEMTRSYRLGRLTRRDCWRLDQATEMRVSKFLKGREHFTIYFMHLGKNCRLVAPADRTSTNRVFEHIRNFLIRQGRASILAKS